MINYEGEHRNELQGRLNPLAGFLKPQSPAERLAAQHKDREKLQRERQLKELQVEEAKARGEAGKRPVGCLRGFTPHRPLRVNVESREWLLLHVFPSPLFPCF